HHDVWILSQNVAQPFGKGEVDLRLHVNLRNAGEPIFHRFLDRDDPALDRINGGEKAIKRSRFAAAGRPSEQNDSVRLGEQVANDTLLVRAQIKSRETELLTAAAEQAQTDRLAVHRRDRRNPHIDFLMTLV